MQRQFDTAPAYLLEPGTIVLPDGIVFGTVIREREEDGSLCSCGVLLYRRGSSQRVRVPFTADCFSGSFCSMKITGLKAEEWYYNYYCGDLIYTDPYARRIVHGKNRQEPDFTMGGFLLPPSFSPASPSLPVPTPAKRLETDGRVLYCLHVKGFTRSPSSGVARDKRGTFAGVIEKIPHLQALGVTSLELLPVFEPKLTPREKAQKLPNYWNFCSGYYYFAPRAEYAAGDDPQEEFGAMTRALHEAGMEVILQLYFPDGTVNSEMLDAARFYVRAYGVDGFHLMGQNLPLKQFARDPVLSDTALYYYTFPYEELLRESKETSGPFALRSVSRLFDYNDDYLYLLRKFVKSDDYVTPDFIHAFLEVPGDHGSVRYVTNYAGFTLADLVSYSHKHNEANGEENSDGNDRNESWNCGAEGRSRKRQIQELRQRQIRNFLILLFLTQGTPLLTAGDERLNSQGGNNNPYCQDNETGWVNWNEGPQAQETETLVAALSAFRREHPILRAAKPFQYSDYLSVGFPDVSLHGREPWKPELNPYSHTIGILFCEAYAQRNAGQSREASGTDNGEQSAQTMQSAPPLLYIAVNMHWKPQQLGLPTLPQTLLWACAADSSRATVFADIPEILSDQQSVTVPERSVQILVTAAAPQPESGSRTGNRAKKRKSSLSGQPGIPSASGRIETLSAFGQTEV